MDKNDWVISVSQEIHDKNGVNLGVLLLDIDYEVIDNYLEDLNLGSQGYSFIIDKNLNLVYHPDVEVFEDNFGWIFKITDLLLFMISF